MAIIMNKTPWWVLTVMLLAGPASAQVRYNATKFVGCYSSVDSFDSVGSYTYQSNGHCQTECIPESGGNAQPVMALTKGDECQCGSDLPPDSDKVDDDKCDESCTGFPDEMCGGKNTFSVYLTGLDENLKAADDSSSDDDSEDDDSEDDDSNQDESVSKGQRATITKAGETVLVTAAGQPATTEEAAQGDAAEDSGPNKVAIAVGVVVGVVVLGALIGAAVFFIRRRRRKAVHEEHRRNQARGNLVGSEKVHSKSGSLSDQRLDPSICHRRRQSDGSIADEMDFSRKILQVRNPDGV